MSDTSAVLLIEPRLSRRLAVLVLATHGGALVSWWLFLVLQMEAGHGSLWGYGVGLVGVSSLIGASLVHHWRCHVWRSGRRAVRRAWWQADGHWRLELGDGGVCEARLARDYYVNPRVVVLNFSVEHATRRFSLVLFDDAVPGALHRRLRVRLSRIARQ